MNPQTQADTDGVSIDRRTFVRTVGVTSAVAAGASGVSPISPTQNAEAIGFIGGAVIVGAAAVAGWAVRETEIIGSDADPPPDGLGPEALHRETYRALRTRKSALMSTIQDSQNLLNASQDTAWTEGKIAAIEALNDEKTKSEVISAGEKAVNEYYDTVESNFRKSIKEFFSELHAYVSSVKQASDTSISEVFDTGGDSFPNLEDVTNKNVGGENPGVEVTVSENGTDTAEYYLNSWSGTETGNGLHISNPTDNGAGELKLVKTNQGGDYLDWWSVLSSLDNQRQTAISNINLWADNIYGDVQSGEISTADLRGPSTIARELSEQQSNAAAVADLLALNIPGSYGNDVTVEYDTEETNLGTATATGVLANTDGASVSEGDTIDPSNTPGDWYLSARVGSIETQWTAYNSSRGVDGGIIEFTSNPVHVGIDAPASELVFGVSTSKGETVSVGAGEFVEKDQNVPITWEADISEKLDNDIADIEQVTVYLQGGDGSTVDPKSYQNLRLTEPFTVTATPNGEDVSFSESPRDPQTDENYVTQEEWNSIEDSIMDQIESYESSKSDPVVGGGNLFGGGGLPSLPGFSFVESAIIVLGGGWLLSQFSN